MESPGFLIAVALATGGLVVLHLLWQILRLPIAAPREFRQLRRMPVTAALAGPIEEALTELGALGFERDGWVVVEAVPNEAYSMRVFGCLRHRSEPVLAAIQLRPELRRVEHCPVVFHSLLANGRLLRTYNHAPRELPPQSPFDERQDARADTLAAQWALHRASVHERRAQIAPLPPTARLVALTLAGDRHLIDWRLHQRQFECDDAGVVRFSPRSALALLLRGPFPLRKRAFLHNAPVSPERQAVLFHHWAWTQQQAPRWGVQCALFGLSALILALLGAALWSIAAALGIFVALVAHEAARCAAQRAAGRRDAPIRMIPLIGGDAGACGPKPSARRQAWVDLAAPLAGVAIGWLLYAAKPPEGSGVAVLAACFIVVNGLSLLPLSPFDGGRFLRAMVPARHARVVTFVEGAVLLAALLACAHARALAMTVVVAALLVQLSRRLHVGDIVEKLASQPDVADGPREYDQVVGIAAALDHGAFARTPMVRRMPLIRRVREDLRRVPVSRMQAALLIAVHAALLALALPMAARLLPVSARDAGWQARAAELDGASASIAAQADTLDVAHLVAAFREEPGATDARLALPYDHDAVDARFSALLGRVASADEHRALAAGVVVDDYEPQVATLQSLRAAAPSAFESLAAGPGRTLEASHESDGERRAIDVGVLGDALAFARKSRSEWLVLPRVADGTEQPVWAVTFVAGELPTVVEHASLRDWFASHWQATRVRALQREQALAGGATVAGGG